MNLFDRLVQIEMKDFDKLSEEELLILNYCNTYKEANLYYELMTSCIKENLPDLGLVYATKGKLASTQAITLQSKLKLIWANNKVTDFDGIFKMDRIILDNNLDGVTVTVHQLESKGQFGNVIQLIPAPAPKNTDLVKAKLAQQGLVIPQNADPKVKANVSLKILDNLLLTGQISQKVYNQKCREVMLKKPKSA